MEILGITTPINMAELKVKLEALLVNKNLEEI